MIRMKRWTVLSLSALLAAGCDVTPSGPELDGGEAELIEVVEASWSQLTTMEELGVQALEAGLGAQAGELHGLFLEAALMAAELEDARAEGLNGPAGTLEVEAEVAWAAFAVAALGDDTPGRVVEGADAVLSQLEALPSPRSSEAGVRMSQARERLRAARAALDRGDGPRALREGAQAAAELQSISPARRAYHAVNRAEALLARAMELAGPDVEGRLAEALESAREACAAGRRALEGELWRVAVAQAQICASISRAVIARLAGAVPDDALADLAEAAVEQAWAYLNRAKEVLGDDLPDGVARALDRAEELLESARFALSQESYRRAIVLAHGSAAISRRLLVWAMGDGTDWLEARARVAVGTAQALLKRAQEAAGDDPEPHVAEVLERVEGLVSDAAMALEAGRWRMAIYKAHKAIPILRRVLHYLS